MCLLIAVVLANLWVVSSRRDLVVDYFVDNCKNAEIAPGSDLFVAKAHVIVVNKDSRRKKSNFFTEKCRQQIFEKKKSVKWDLTSDQYSDQYFDNTELVLGLLVVRGGKTRVNDNPVVFHHQYYSECAWDKYQKTGTGSDFSEMYFGSPFRPGRIVISIEEGGKKTTLLDYNPPRNCYSTGSWIANEGVYLLDVATQEWYPIYYDIRDAVCIF